MANLIWELAQLPLYTLWTTATPPRIIWAAIHCTVGDALIAAAALAAGWLAARRPPLRQALPVHAAVITIIAGVAYTVFSEWWNTEIARAWEYVPAMPLVPGTIIGLAPVLQWMLLPGLALWMSFGLRR